jgi:hypothetical protein
MLELSCAGAGTDIARSNAIIAKQHETNFKVRIIVDSPQEVKRVGVDLWGEHYLW